MRSRWSSRSRPWIRTTLLLPGPVLVRRARLGLTWQVMELLEAWTHPHYLSVTFREPAECRYRLKARGPRARRRGERGEFVMVLRPYRDRRGCRTWESPGG